MISSLAILSSLFCTITVMEYLPIRGRDAGLDRAFPTLLWTLGAAWGAVLLWWLAFMVGGIRWVHFWDSSRGLSAVYASLNGLISCGMAAPILVAFRFRQRCRSVSAGLGMPQPGLRMRLTRVGLFAVVASVVLAGDMICNRLEVARLPQREGKMPEGSDAPARLAAHVQRLAGEIGIRDATHPDRLEAASDYIQREFRSAGLEPRLQPYQVPLPDGSSGSARMVNISVVVPGAAGGAPVFVVGTHYDSAEGTPGADDNASAVAALLELARRLKGAPGRVELHLVAFSTEEPPYFGTRDMGSYRYARALKDAGRNVEGMMSLEMLGYYRDEKGSQKYPPFLSPFFPDRGNYLGIVSDLGSRRLMRRVTDAFGKHPELPVIGAAVPGIISSVGLSDHSSFWANGFKAVMVTDTAFLRNPNYHRETDLPATLDYRRMAIAVDGLERSLLDLRR